MIYDCFPFFNELDMLELRLNTLNDYVDRFVLVESDVTFTGEPKPLYFEENKDRFSDFVHKIEHVVVRNMPKTNEAWDRDIFQRNCSLRGLSKARPNDIITFCDADEIPNIPQVEADIRNDQPHALHQRMYYYKFNMRVGDWARATATMYKAMKGTPQQMRRNKQRPLIRDGGWHFSYVMAPELIAHKIKSFAHQEFNSDNFTDVEKINERIADQRDPFDRKNRRYRVEPIDDSFPKYLIDNQERFREMIAPW